MLYRSCAPYPATRSASSGYKSVQQSAETSSDFATLVRKSYSDVPDPVSTLVLGNALANDWRILEGQACWKCLTSQD